MLRVLVIGIITILSFAVPVGASEDATVVRVRALMDEAEYAEAQRVITHKLTRSRVDKATRTELYWLEGICWISLEQPLVAQSAFLKLLSIAPSFEPPTLTSPKVAEVFRKTQTAFLAQGGADKIYQPQLTPLDNQLPEQNVPVFFQIENTDRITDIQRIVLHLRQTGMGDYVSIDFKPTESIGSYTATIPAYLIPKLSESYRIEYYVEVLSPSGKRLSGIGQVDFSLSFIVVTQDILFKPSLLKKSKSASAWPYWVAAGIGTTIVIGAILVGVLSSNSNEGGMRIHITSSY